MPKVNLPEKIALTVVRGELTLMVADIVPPIGCEAFQEYIPASLLSDAEKDRETRLFNVTSAHCRCGGSGPDDPNACDACKIYHALKGSKP